MITVEFKAENVSLLKADIIAYASQLGGGSQTTATIEVNATPQPRAARAAKKEKVEPIGSGGSTAPQTAIMGSASTTIPDALVTQIPTDTEVQESLVAVNDKLGIDKAIEALAKFGVKRGRELLPAQKRPFMEYCQSLVK